MSEKNKKIETKQEIAQHPNKLVIGLCVLAIIALATMMILVASGVVGPGIFKTY